MRSIPHGPTLYLLSESQRDAMVLRLLEHNDQMVDVLLQIRSRVLAGSYSGMRQEVKTMIDAALAE